MSDDQDRNEAQTTETATIDADAHRLARIMIAEARRVAMQEAATHMVEKMTEAKYDVERDIVGRLTAFFYLLLRDKLPVGVVNELTKEVLSADKCQYSDDVLLVKAESIANMLACGEYTVTEMEAKAWVKGSEEDPSVSCDSPED